MNGHFLYGVRAPGFTFIMGMALQLVPDKPPTLRKDVTEFWNVAFGTFRQPYYIYHCDSFAGVRLRAALLRCNKGL